MSKASISIFHSEHNYESDVSSPQIPDDIFIAAKRVIANKSCEFVKSIDGVYIVNYSENGPWNTNMLQDEWLPVYIARIEKWSSGGIKVSELQEFNNEHK